MAVDLDGHEREALVAVRRRTRGRVLVATAVLAGGALLAGCSAHPGAAAVVDGRTIGVDELATASEQLSPIFQGAATQDLLGVLITEPYVTAVAADRGVGVSDQQARDLLRTVTEQALGEEAAADAEFGAGALAVARYSLAATALQDLPDAQAAAQEFQERVAEADVEVNPRFGTFEGGVVAAPTLPAWVVGADAQPTE